MKSLAESGGVRSITRARSSAARAARYSGAARGRTDGGRESAGGAWYSVNSIWPTRAGSVPGSTGPLALRTYTPGVDRKSTRLNSSHSQISYAVFCLKKKKENQHADTHANPTARNRAGRTTPTAQAT